MQNILNDIECRKDEPMKKHTTFRIGGPARFFYVPKNIEELKLIIQYCKNEKLKYMIIGNGSNMLFLDEGFDGAVICVGSSMGNINVDNISIYAEAGALLSKVASSARDAGLTGMEFAAGIPGTIGGAIVMNAGAYGGEMKDIVSFVDILEADGNLRRYSNEEMQFGYRRSIVDADKVVVGVGLKLACGNIDDINVRMDELKTARVSKQPLEFPSAGSTFKRPEGYFAGKLIDDCGLRGYRVGGAMVSEKHCGFVINYDNATAKDVLKLIDDVKNKVYDEYNVLLEPEVRIVI